MQPALERPRFRNDLVAQPIEEEGIRYVDVTDPNSGNTFRFYDVEYSIACAMDGRRSIDALAQWTLAELGIETSADELTNVVNTLAELGYLDAGAGIDRDVSAAYDQAMELGPAGRSPLEEPAPPPPPTEPVELGAPGIPIPTETSQRRQIEPEQAAQELETLELHEMAEHPSRKTTVPPPVPGEPPKREEETSFAGLLEEEQEHARAAATKDEGEPPREVAMEAEEPPHPLDDDDPTKIPRPMMAPPDEEPDEEDHRVDLSAHLALGKEEVKEAIRSSRVHDVPEIPTDLRDVAEPPPPRAEPRQPALIVEDQRAMSVASLASPTATPLPERPPTARAPRPLAPIEPSRVQPAIRPPEQKRRSSLGLWIVLLLLVAGGLAVYAFKDQIFGADGFSSSRPKPAAQPATTPPTETKPEAKPETPPPPPPETAPALPSAAVREDVAGGGEIKAPAEGQIAWVAEPGATVEAGAPIAKYLGFKKEEARIVEGQQRGEYYAKVLAEAEKNGDAEKAGQARGKVEEKKRMVDEATAALDKLLVKAPSAGKISKASKPRPVRAGDVLVEMEGGGKALRATFDAGDAAGKYSAGQNVSVAPKAARDKEIAAVVDSVDAGKVTVRLSGGAAAGDEVVLLPPR